MGANSTGGTTTINFTPTTTDYYFRFVMALPGGATGTYNLSLVAK